MKSQIKRIFAGAILVFGSLACVTDANAECTKTGVVISSFTAVIAGFAGTFYNVVPVGQLLPTFADQYFVAVPGSNFNQELSAAQTAGQVVRVTGTTTTCVATGAFRNQGNVTSVVRFAQ